MQSLASFSRLRIQRCRELWSRLQMRLGFDPERGKLKCIRYNIKKKKKKKKKKGLTSFYVAAQPTLPKQLLGVMGNKPGLRPVSWDTVSTPGDLYAATKDIITINGSHSPLSSSHVAAAPQTSRLMQLQSSNGDS